MISVKYASIIAVAAFVTGSFVASPELRAYAANTVGSADIINNSILSADIKDGEVKAVDIATDAVGAAELQGVTKLLFGKCVLNSEASALPISPGVNLSTDCNISGVDTNDRAIATLTEGNNCFDLKSAETNEINKVRVTLKNECSFTTTTGSGTEVSIIVFDK